MTNLQKKETDYSWEDRSSADVKVLGDDFLADWDRRHDTHDAMAALMAKEGSRLAFLISKQ